jgi:hypothetical protein
MEESDKEEARTGRHEEKIGVGIFLPEVEVEYI